MQQAKQVSDKDERKTTEKQLDKFFEEALSQVQDLCAQKESEIMSWDRQTDSTNRERERERKGCGGGVGLLLVILTLHTWAVVTGARMDSEKMQNLSSDNVFKGKLGSSICLSKF